MKDYLLRRKYVVSPSASENFVGEILWESVDVKSVVGSRFGRDKGLVLRILSQENVDHPKTNMQFKMNFALKITRWWF